LESLLSRSAHPSGKFSPHLKVVALIDPAIGHATTVLAKKCETFVRSADEHTCTFKTLEDFVENIMTP
jgi:hypothetical protein